VKILKNLVKLGFRRNSTLVKLKRNIKEFCNKKKKILLKKIYFYIKLLNKGGKGKVFINMMKKLNKKLKKNKKKNNKYLTIFKKYLKIKVIVIKFLKNK
jgi:hypothetical protein